MCLLSKSFKKVVVVSKDMQKIFTNRLRFKENKVAMIHNGADIPDCSTKKREKSKFIVGSMGRIYPVKDYPLMVEVAREVSKRTDKIQFVLAGDGPDRGKIMELIERNGLRNMFLLKGFVDNLSEFYPYLDLYMNTSLHEGIPMSILEAMSYELPIIAPNVGGIKEIVNNGIEGYLLDERDPKRFADLCLQLQNNNNLRKSMGVSARHKIENEYSNERMAKEYNRLYLDLVGGIN